MDILASPSRHRISSYRSSPFFPPLLTDFTILSPSTRLVSLTKAPVIKQVSRLDVSRWEKRESFYFRFSSSTDNSTEPPQKESRWLKSATELIERNNVMRGTFE